MYQKLKNKRIEAKKKVRSMTKAEAFQMLKDGNIYVFLAWIISFHKELLLVAIILLIINPEKIQTIKSWLWDSVSRIFN